jgi:hypothetical protein
MLVSRLPGLDGAKSTKFHYDPAISGDGKVVAFRSSDQTMVPGTGLWAADQIVSRVLSTGTNRLVSRAKSGAVANAETGKPSLNRDGSMIAFNSYATNLIARRGGDDREAVFIKNMKSGRLSGPPAFGITGLDAQTGARWPSISANGRCLLFLATGYNAASGNASDIPSVYVYAAARGCSNPKAAPRPKLSGVSFRPSKVALTGPRNGTLIRFRLNATATVTITFVRQGPGRRFTGRLVKRNQRRGAHRLRFSGRAGKRRLKPGRYRVTVTARNRSGASRAVRKTIRVTRR